MTQRLSVIVAAALVISTLHAQSSRPAAQEPLALTNAVAIDVRTGSLVSNATIVLRGGRIESVGVAPAPPGVRAIDLAGKFVLPGLVDAHTHASDFAAMRRALQSGVTTVRSSGVSNYADVGFRELAKAGAIDGPDVVASGYHVRPRIADEAFLSDPSFADLMGGVTTIDALRRAVQMNLAHGVDWIKILATERAGTPDTDPRIQVYTEDEIRAVVQEAATKNVPVQAHAHGDEGAMAAVRAGVRSIEHGTYLSDATLQAMKARGTYLDPTYTTVIDVAEAGGDYDLPALRIRGAHMLPRLRQTIQRALKMGVKVVTGGDTGYGPNSLIRVGQEMSHFVELGMTPLQAIQSATMTAAELLRMEKSIGQLQQGFQADLIVVDGNPLENVRVVEDPLLVISNGRVAVNRLRFSKTSSSSQ